MSGPDSIDTRCEWFQACRTARLMRTVLPLCELDVYAAREQPLAGISGATIAEQVTVPVTYVPDFSAVPARVAAAAEAGDVIVTMGAGDVTLLGKEILAELTVKANRRAPGSGAR